jgi:hypothetical protein
MMIEYSIEDLKYYYSKYHDATHPPIEYTVADVEKIRYLEDKVSDLIDDEYTKNSIYHIFPVVAVAAVATAATAFAMTSTLLLG